MKNFGKLATLSASLCVLSCGAQNKPSTESSLQSIQGYEDCIGFSDVTAQVQNIGGSWRIVDGAHSMFDFGSNFSEAQLSLQIIKHSHARYSCFVKRPHAKMQYLLNASGDAISGNLLASEDCISFNPSLVSVQNVGGSWRLVQGAMSMLDFGPGLAGQQQANTARNVIVNKRFDKQCFVGRPNPSFTYWKKTVLIPIPLPHPTAVVVDSCSDYQALAGATFQCPGNQVAVGMFDHVAPLSQFETLRCCSLKAGAAPVLRTGGITFTNKVFGGSATCPANGFVTGVTFDAAGGFQGFTCQSLVASGHNVSRVGAESQGILASGSGAACTANALMTGVADTLAVDGDIDNIRCQSAVRNAF